MAKIPKQIDHVHILDSVVEIRFVAKNDQTVVLDILDAVRSQISNYRFVPSDIPRQFRQADPQLQYSVELTLIGERFSIGIGSNTIVFNCQNGYKTWSEFSPFIVSILGSIGSHVEKVLRVGVRFTNFFEGKNDLRLFKIAFSAGSSELIKKDSTDMAQMVVKFSSSSNDGSYNVTIANQAKVPNKSLPGTLLDVDAYTDQQNLKIGVQLFNCIEDTHLMEKIMFFSLLEPSFLETLNPKY